MAQPFIAQISCFAGNFAPIGWMFCNGQLLPISQYDALYAVIGTTYGGDGVTTFALPNLQGRTPMHWGNGPNGFTTEIGQAQGSSNITLTTGQIPSHNHAVTAVQVPSNAEAERSPVPSSTAYLSDSARPSGAWKIAPTAVAAQFSNKAIGVSGASQAHENMQPWLGLNFCIAVQGVFPSRN
jgi:microcystin-dependent protein